MAAPTSNTVVLSDESDAESDPDSHERQGPSLRVATTKSQNIETSDKAN